MENTENNSFLVDNSKEIAINYLRKPKPKNYDTFFESQISFLENLNTISFTDIKTTYEKNPEYFFSVYRGVHPLFYFAMTNNYDKFNFAIEKNISDNHLKELPNLGKNFLQEKQRTPLSQFCASKNLHKSLPTLFIYLSNFNEQLILNSFKASILENSKEVFDFIKSYIKEENYQEACFKTINTIHKGEMFLSYFLKKNSNMKKLEEFGFDLEYNKHDQNNYLCLYLANILANRKYYNPTGSSSSIEKNELKFLKSMFSNINYFVKEKGFNFNQSIGENNLEKIVYSIIDTCSYIDSIDKNKMYAKTKEYSVYCLAKSLKNKETISEKKIKI